MDLQLKQLLRNLPVSRKVYLTERDELARAVHALQDGQHSLYVECALLRAELAKLRGELKTEVHTLEEQIQDLRWQIRVRDSLLAPPAESLTPHDPDYHIEKCFQKLAAIAPKAYTLWRELLDVNGDAYDGFPADSCSVPGHAIANKFRHFLWPYLTGPVLDIGCGPQPMPWYLEGYPSALIAGLDPLPAPQPHPFAFAQGVAEYLPWGDGTFQVVTVSTSLDHVLYVDRAMAEIRRVLKPGGHFITWVSLMKGARPYNPYADDVQKVDRFHLFHFDRPYFESVTAEHFIRAEEVDADGLSFFYSFRPRP